MSTKCLQFYMKAFNLLRPYIDILGGKKYTWGRPMISPLRGEGGKNSSSRSLTALELVFGHPKINESLSQTIKQKTNIKQSKSRKKKKHFS